MLKTRVQSTVPPRVFTTSDRSGWTGINYMEDTASFCKDKGMQLCKYRSGYSIKTNTGFIVSQKTKFKPILNLGKLQTRRAKKNYSMLLSLQVWKFNMCSLQYMCFLILPVIGMDYPFLTGYSIIATIIVTQICKKISFFAWRVCVPPLKSNIACARVRKFSQQIYLKNCVM